MPHQCLNCGHIIEKGSDEILKGCSQCGGKKFMFTSRPMSEEKRKGIKRRADRVRDRMISKADPELLKILKEKGMTDLEGSHLEMDSSLGDDWVRVSPQEEDEEEEEKIEIDQGSSPTSSEIVGPSDESRRSARDLIEEFDREMGKKEESAVRSGPQKKNRTRRKRPQKKTSKKRPAEKSPPARKKKKRPARPKGKKRKDVDVINIVEQGVYEIDVEKLLEEGPIVVQKDGSYLLHLPSLFKEGKESK